MVLTLDSRTDINEVKCYDKNDNNREIHLNNKKSNSDEESPYYEWIRQNDKIMLKLDSFNYGSFAVAVICEENFKGTLDFEIDSK